MIKFVYVSDGNYVFVKYEWDLVDIFNKEFGDVFFVIV